MAIGFSADTTPTDILLINTGYSPVIPPIDIFNGPSVPGTVNLVKDCEGDIFTLSSVVFV
jgi:hypothetical protein